MAVQHVPAGSIPSDRSAIDADGFTSTVGRFRSDSNEPRGWHHHGEHHVVAYVIEGTIRVESGPGGTILTEPAPGDLVHIEPGTVHRETYIGDIAIVGFTVGSGPGRIDVDGPEPAG
jgi:quercetin dioxygenase-like cupin family protein